LENYNSLVENLNEINIKLHILTLEENISINDSQAIESLILEYNNVNSNLSNKFNLSLIKLEIQNLFEDIDFTFENLNKSFNDTYSYSNIANPNIAYLVKTEVSLEKFELDVVNQKEKCCYQGICEPCCNDSCKNNISQYPIILVHGHSFNDKISADSSLGDMNSIKDSLIQEGIIDGGYVIMPTRDKTGVFAKTPKQMVFTISYYFDIYQNDQEITNFQSKQESLDTYALRLNDIIENVKVMTNKDKVNIVAHSMGGLVSRRYMQVYGEESVNNLIMVGTPNHGVDGYMLTSCPILGADIHCDMMNKDSLFINKLNNGEIPNTNVSMIVGLGCTTEGSPSDGVVKNESAYLSWAKNYFVYGNCSGVDFFHVTMRDMQKYPEVSEIIKKELGLSS
jgi:hypothetical protein